MCLITKEHRQSVAKEELHVYKVLLYNKRTYNNRFQCFHSPYFFETRWKPGETKQAKIGKKKVIKGGTIRSLYKVEEGLHVLTSLETAFCFMKKLYCVYNEEYVIVECTVPKGARYYTSDGGKEMCVSKLRFDKVYDSEEYPQPFPFKAAATRNQMIEHAIYKLSGLDPLSAVRCN